MKNYQNALAKCQADLDECRSQGFELFQKYETTLLCNSKLEGELNECVSALSQAVARVKELEEKVSQLKRDSRSRSKNKNVEADS